MGKKGIVIGIGQLVLIVLVWMFNPNAMLGYIDRLTLIFGIGCTTGIIAPSMFTSTEDGCILTLATIFEIIYVAALGILWGVIQYNIVI